MLSLYLSRLVSRSYHRASGDNRLDRALAGYNACMNIFGLGAPELLLIVFVMLLFFGKDKLPGLARSLGRSVRELKDGATQSFSADGLLADTPSDVAAVQKK